MEPKSTKQALANPTWLTAMKAEYDAFIENNTWSLISLPPNRVPIGCKWVFRIKENSNSSVNKYKVWLVAKGFHQQYGIYYTETFSPATKPITVRLPLSLVVTYGWPIQLLHVNNVFLNGILEEEVYVATFRFWIFHQIHGVQAS